METVVRRVLAILIGINAGTVAVSAVMAVCAKAGARAHIPNRLLSFYLTLGWPTVLIWLMVVPVFGVAIGLLWSRRKALFTYCTAFALELLVFAVQLNNPDYGLTFSDAHHRGSVTVFALLALAGVVIDWLDLRATAPTARPTGPTRPQGPRPAPG